MPATVLRDVASQHRLYLAAKPSHGLAGGGGDDVDGLPCPLHHPTVYSR
jgi:hypothetical protein